jgi:alpha-D-ribose 1-methylphosphonate 5-triphosphate synthase subunit PhnH
VTAGGAALRPAFADPVGSAQHCFRALLAAMARPGRIEEMTIDLVPPAPVHPAAAAALLTLLDHDAPLWLGLPGAAEEVAPFFAFHCGSPLAPRPEDARFALATPETAPLERFAIGTAERPERSATVLLQLPSLRGGPAVGLQGPGIDGRIVVAPLGLPDGFWDAVRQNGALFPRGIDLLLVCDRALLALPRTVHPER